MRTVYINGKFTAQPTTGVQRVAGCLVGAIDDYLVQSDQSAATRWVLLCPPAGLTPRLERIEVKAVGPRWAGLTLWEQAFLPLECRGSVLLCLAGSASALKAGQVCVIHDAAVFDTPHAYRVAFRAWHRFLFKRLAGTATLIATVSEYSRRRLAHWLNLSASRIVVIHNGADHLEATEADESVLITLGLRKGRYFLVVGSSNSNKNHQAIIEAFSSASLDGDLRLVFVGEANKAVFSTGPRDRGNERVVQAGRVSDGALKALYTAATALVFPSRTEGFGLPPLEAMWCGCPVIASNRAALPEVCGDAALYVDPDRIDDLADAMRRLMADAPLGERLRHNGHRRAREFTWQRAAQALLQHMAGAGVIGPLEP